MKAVIIRTSYIILHYGERCLWRAKKNVRDTVICDTVLQYLLLDGKKSVNPISTVQAALSTV
jgi:hypothetical protein